MREYFESAWRAYRRLRPGAPPRPPAGLFARFARLRPLVESGWEMPVPIHALRPGAPRAPLLRDRRPDAWPPPLPAPRPAGRALPRRRGVQHRRRPRGGANRRAHRPAHARAVRADLFGVGHLLTAMRPRPTIPLRNGWGGHGEPPKGDPR